MNSKPKTSNLVKSKKGPGTIFVNLSRPTNTIGKFLEGPWENLFAQTYHDYPQEDLKMMKNTFQNFLTNSAINCKLSRAWRKRFSYIFSKIYSRWFCLV